MLKSCKSVSHWIVIKSNKFFQTKIIFMKDKNYFQYFFIGLSLVFTSTCLADNAADRAEVEALALLTTAPLVYGVDASGESTEVIETISAGDHKRIFFESLGYANRDDDASNDLVATRAHAWISIPATASPTNKVPAIVLVHGGGGEAFEDWASLWSARGYAAISIDTEGNTHDPNAQDPSDEKVRHSYSGPKRTGVFDEPDVVITDQFMYHASAVTILANSLLRDLNFVDETKIGVHGVSWGGVITSTVIGIDQRFAFAIPAYGCGHMWDAIGNWQTPISVAEDNFHYYREVWDSMLYLENATMPIMWFSWSNDSPFNIDCQANSYNKAPGTQMVSLVQGLGHGHVPTWNRAGPYDFANSVVNTGNSWCTQQSLVKNGNQVEVEFSSTRSLSGAVLIYANEMGRTSSMGGLNSEGGGVWLEETVDSFLETSPGVWTVTATLPAGTTAWFINVAATTDSPGLSARGNTIYVSSRLQDVVNVTQPSTVEFELKVGDTQVSSGASVTFSAINNLEVVSIDFVNETHVGAFSTTEEFLTGLLTNTEFEVVFDNSVAGLNVGEMATSVLRLTWVGLDNVTTSTIDIPLQATVHTPQDIIYDVTANWSSKSPNIVDHVIIRDDAIVTLDQDDVICSLSVGHGATDGELNIVQDFLLTVTDDLVVEDGSEIKISDGVFDYTNTGFNIDGSIVIDGGSLNAEGATIEGTGKLTVLSGSLNFFSVSSIDIAEIEISGGSVNFNTSGGNAQTKLGDNNTSNLTIIGSSPTVLFRIFQAQNNQVTDPIVNFVFDENGVSPIQVSLFMNLPLLTVNVDGSEYTGGEGEVVLMQAGNFATIQSAPQDYYSSGFIGKGLTATFEQDQVAGVLKLVLVNNVYGDWAAGESLAGEQVDFDADPDFDGVDNIFEFILGSDPLNLASASLPVNLIDSENLQFHYTRNTEANVITQQTVEYSYNLKDWFEIGVDSLNPEVTISTGSAANTEDVVVSLEALTPVDGKLFVRLKASLVE